MISDEVLAWARRIGPIMTEEADALVAAYAANSHPSVMRERESRAWALVSHLHGLKSEAENLAGILRARQFRLAETEEGGTHHGDGIQ